MTINQLDSVPEGLGADASTRRKPLPITPEERRRRIEEAAYYRAERRSFGPDESWSDWFDAEREIDESLARLPPD
jgi:hypothetical protein